MESIWRKKSYENSLLPITGGPRLPLVSGIPHDNNQLRLYNR